MGLEQVRAYLRAWNRDKDILELDASTATVPLAAAALGVEEARIAKSISLKNGDGAIVLVVAGDAKIDNRKFKDAFGFKATMLSVPDALRLTGHPVGGVCPFALPEGVKTYLDESMRRFKSVFPACGAGNTAIELTPGELTEYSRCEGWVDVCKLT
jgi:prolyl-tRNA editing enzyme YbaK/EbsC (Cys-tRNA(Pro) deacylase)